jgi:alpha-D-ribose 1-methylphosphonate 5-triphosphate synthase subunit PhnG
MSITIDNRGLTLQAGKILQTRTDKVAGRKEIAETLARATLQELQSAWEQLAAKPEFALVRGPETGLVMVRGRTGGTGHPFNLGEVVVSRATVRLSNGAIGHGHVLGSAPERARLAAMFDAVAQCPEYETVAGLLDSVRLRVSQEDKHRAEEVAATRVDFFTMVRGDD